jgi:transposase
MEPMIGALELIPALPLATGGSQRVADGVEFIEDDDGSGSVFLWGMAAWRWGAGDRVARRLAAVQLVESRAARQRHVARAFGVNEDSLILWRGEYAMKGAAGLAGRRPGPKGPSKLTAPKRAEICALRADGLTLAAVAERVGVSTDTVRRALGGAPPPASTDEAAGESSPGQSLHPAEDADEREAPMAGLLTEATPVIREGPSLPLAGSLIVLPALAGTGLLDAATRVYDTEGAASCTLRALLLSIVFACLLDEPRPEGLPNIDPGEIGRLVGLDRALDVGTMRQRMSDLAALGRADRLIDALARRQLENHRKVAGIFDVDGCVRAYDRSVDVGPAHVARIRLETGAGVDTRVLDRNGDGVLVWTTPAQASVVHELRTVTTKVRGLVGPAARPTVCFDHGGWSPKLFAELTAAGFDILTFRKPFAHAEPGTAFHRHVFTDASRHDHDYLLADRDVPIGYDSGRRRFTCRQITRLNPCTGAQTHILTTRDDPDPAIIAHATSHGLSQEILVRHMRAVDGRDLLDSYTRVAGDPAELPVIGAGTSATSASGLAPECKRIQDAARVASHNASSALARLLAPLQARADDAARNLLREAFRTPADVQLVGKQLHVRLESLCAPRRSQAIAALCDALTASNTRYPGTDLTLVYSMRDDW